MSNLNMKDKYLSLTEEKIGTAMLRFALPFFIANVLQALYGAIDLLIIGRFCTSAAISAVSTGSQVMTTLLGIIMGISTGSTVLIAQSVGEKNGKKAAYATGSSAVLFAIIAVVITPLLIIFAKPILKLMHTPAEAELYAQQYLIICTCGIPFILGYNAVSGVFRGIGDSKTPMILVAISSLVNLTADIILVGKFKLGAAGAAYATAFSQMLSLLIAIVYIKKKGFPFELHREHFKPDKASFRFILKVGSPLAIQEALVDSSFLIITAIVNVMGVVASASVGIVEKIMMFSMMPPMAFSSAVTTMTAQNIGAQKPERALKSLWYGIGYSLIFGVSICVVSQVTPQTLTAVFAADKNVVKMAATYLRPYSFDCVLICIIFAMNSYFNGCGKSMVSFIHSMIATFCVRLPICWMARKYCVGTLAPMGIGAPMASVVSLAICTGYFIWMRKKGIGMMEQKMQ